MEERRIDTSFSDHSLHQEVEYVYEQFDADRSFDDPNQSCNFQELDITERVEPKGSMITQSK